MILSTPLRAMKLTLPSTGTELQERGPYGVPPIPVLHASSSLDAVAPHPSHP
jgi:hypothetical protein